MNMNQTDSRSDLKDNQNFSMLASHYSTEEARILSQRMQGSSHPSYPPEGSTSNIASSNNVSTKRISLPKLKSSRRCNRNVETKHEAKLKPKKAISTHAIGKKRLQVVSKSQAKSKSLQTKRGTLKASTGSIEIEKSQSKQWNCTICLEQFNVRRYFQTSQALGGHKSKAHPGESREYADK